MPKHPPRPATTMALRRYAPLGRCMYCLAIGVALSEEHLIPKSLGGRLTLRDSVCEPCRVRTGRLEQATLDRDFAIPKTLLALRRRRARQAGPRRLPPLGGTLAADAGAARWPREFWLPAFAPAGRLAGVEGAPPEAPARFVRCRLQLGTPRDAVAPPAPVLADPFAYGWSIAKWAYAFAVAERGLGGFDTRAMRALLAGERDDVFDFVGNPEPGRPPEADRTVLHAPRLHERAGGLVVELGLLGSAGMTPYEVAVGTLPAAG